MRHAKRSPGLGRKKIISSPEPLTAKKRRTPCWPTRCTLESFYRVNVTNTASQLIEHPKGASERDFGGIMGLSINRIQSSAWPTDLRSPATLWIMSGTNLSLTASSHISWTSCEISPDLVLGTNATLPSSHCLQVTAGDSISTVANRPKLPPWYELSVDLFGAIEMPKSGARDD